MSGPVPDKGDEVFWFVENFQNFSDDVKVLKFIFGSKVIDLTACPFLCDGINTRTVIIDIQPVPDVFTIAVDGERFVLQGIENYQGDHLFRILVWAKIV